MNCLNLPSITSLTLNLSELEPSHVRLIFPNDILTNRLFKFTPDLPQFTQSGMIRMGDLQITSGLANHKDEIFLMMYNMVSLSVTELETIPDMLDESDWRVFARQRPEVCSISSSYSAKNNWSGGLWGALLPDKRNPSTTLFPKLKTLTLKAEHLSMIPRSVLDCLKMRSEAGFKLERLDLQDTGKIRHVGRQPEEFRALADAFVYCEVPITL